MESRWKRWCACLRSKKKIAGKSCNSRANSIRSRVCFHPDVDNKTMQQFSNRDRLSGVGDVENNRSRAGYSSVYKELELRALTNQPTVRIATENDSEYGSIDFVGRFTKGSMSRKKRQPSQTIQDTEKQATATIRNEVPSVMGTININQENTIFQQNLAGVSVGSQSGGENFNVYDGNQESSSKESSNLPHVCENQRLEPPLSPRDKRNSVKNALILEKLFEVFRTKTNNPNPDIAKKPETLRMRSSDILTPQVSSSTTQNLLPITETTLKRISTLNQTSGHTGSTSLESPASTRPRNSLVCLRRQSVVRGA